MTKEVWLCCRGDILVFLRFEVDRSGSAWTLPGYLYFFLLPLILNGGFSYASLSIEA
jgi:hypothetical protein